MDHRLLWMRNHDEKARGLRNVKCGATEVSKIKRMELQTKKILIKLEKMKH